jgi:hypothetical protein
MNLNRPEYDPLDTFLSQNAEEANDKLRLEIQQKTLGILRRRRWLRRGSWLAGLAACYLAGILTMSMWPRPKVNPRVAIAPDEDTAGRANTVPPTAEPTPPTHAQPPESALAAESARDLEWKALDSLKKRPDLFRLAGDMYLLENDLPSATRCYRGALEDASDQDLKISVNDNWLLMSLKQIKQEEKRYAKLIRQ